MRWDCYRNNKNSEGKQRIILITNLKEISINRNKINMINYKFAQSENRNWIVELISHNEIKMLCFDRPHIWTHDFFSPFQPRRRGSNSEKK